MRARVGAWFQASVNRRILAAALTVGAVASVVKLTAMVKDLAIAYRFGTGDAIDAFLIAFLIPSLVINVVAGSLAPAFTPVYIEVRETQGRGAAGRLFASATAGSAVVLLAFTGILLAVMPLGFGVLAGGFNEEKLALTRSLFFLMAPVVLLNSVITMWSAALNAEERFAWAALAPISVPLLTLVFVVFAARALGVYALAAGTLVGFAAQCAVLALALARHDLPMVPRWSGVTPELRRVAGQYLPMVAGAALTTGSWVIGQTMAALLPAGSVASLNYGNKIVSMTTEVGSMALATALLPHFSVMVARAEWPAIRWTIRTYLRLIVLAAVPLTIVLVLVSHPIVQVLFERGAFTAADTTLVARVQALYMLQLPFVMAGMVFVRLASSLQKNHILLWGAAITLPLNVVLNLVLMRRLGVAGIALSTSLVYVVSFCYLALSSRRALRMIEASRRAAG